MFKVTFFVEDNKLGVAKRLLAGVARDVRDEPVINAEPKGRNGVAAKVPNGDIVTLLDTYLVKKGLATVNSGTVRDFAKSLGRAQSSYTYYISKARKAGLLKKTPGTKGTGTTYDVVRK